MAVDVAVYQISPVHRRSTTICDAMIAGIRVTGDRVKRFSECDYTKPIAPVAVFYGYINNLPRIMKDYRDQGLAAVYIDLGYWGRLDGGRFDGYHKVSVNSRHPTAYFQKKPKDSRRAAKFKVRPRTWRRRGQHILLAGMSDKAAEAEGFSPEQWERSTIEEIRKYTDRPIIYRPKPSWRGALPIEGTAFNAGALPLDAALKRAHAVVTHHSNVAVDGLVTGVPAFCWDGVATPLASQSLSEIETPRLPDNRAQWINDIAWVQWNVLEMRRGKTWRYLKNEGLVP